MLPTTTTGSLLDHPELQAISRWAHQQPRATQENLLAALPDLLPALQPDKASAVLVTAGGLVENGANPDLLLPAALGHLHRLQVLHTNNEQVPPAAWRFTVMSLMAMLTRSRKGRAQLRAEPDLLDWLREHDHLSNYFEFLQHMAATSDEATLWVLFPTYGTGLEVAVEQVNNTFHLLTLVQPLVREQAAALGLQRPPEPTNPDLLAYARGESYDILDASDHARLEWLTADAYAGPGQELHHASVAWGEAPVASLPRLRGHVLLLADDPPKRMQRSWDAGFLASVHDANRATVRLCRLLPPAEVQTLLAELATTLGLPTTNFQPTPPPPAKL